jgi:small-conductance mechanosensitive channel
MDFSRAWKTIIDIANGIIAGLPNFILALIFFGIFYIIAKRVRQFVIYVTEKRQRAKNLGIILGKLAQGGVITIGLLVTLTILIPSFNPGDLIQLLGIGSVAVGFAFHDLFQNFLAGILLLLTSPFHIGDQIVVDAYEGTVEDIEMRATTIKTYDARRIVIPNADLFTHSVVVNTAFRTRRLQYEVGVGYEENIDDAKALILKAVNSVEGVMHEPPAEAFVVALADTSVMIRVYWWTTMPQHLSILRLQDKVLTVLKNRLVESGVDLPLPAQMVYFQRQANNSNSNGQHENNRDILMDRIAES